MHLSTRRGVNTNGVRDFIGQKCRDFRLAGSSPSDHPTVLLDQAQYLSPVSQTCILLQESSKPEELLSVFSQQTTHFLSFVYLGTFTIL